MEHTVPFWRRGGRIIPLFLYIWCLSSSVALRAEGVSFSGAAERVLSRTGGVKLELYDVSAILTRLGVETDGWQLQTFIADQKGEHVAALLNHPQKGYRLYKDGTLLRQGATPIRTDPVPFTFTADGHLLVALGGTKLLLDGRELTAKGSTYDFGKGQNSAVYDAKGVAFPQKSSVVYVDTATGKKKTYGSAGGEVQLLRKAGNDLYYSVRKGDTYLLFKNGQQYAKTTLAVPWGFIVTHSGGVLFLAQDETGYTVYRGKTPWIRETGKAAFLMEDGSGNIWHAGYSPVQRTIGGVSFSSNAVVLYRNRDRVTNLDLANVEMSLAFFGAHYALRAAPGKQKSVFFSWPQEWKLLKDGELKGESFTFSQSRRDFSGMHFALNGMVYMRNFDEAEGRWELYEDGKKILQTSFCDLSAVNVNGAVVRVYGVQKGAGQLGLCST